jgi:hypothetical protein
LLSIGSAAPFVAVHAALILVDRRDRHKGAIYCEYRQPIDHDPYFDPITEDAPPLWGYQLPDKV